MYINKINKSLLFINDLLLFVCSPRRRDGSQKAGAPGRLGPAVLHEPHQAHRHGAAGEGAGRAGKAPAATRLQACTRVSTQSVYNFILYTSKIIISFIPSKNKQNPYYKSHLRPSSNQVRWCE